MNRTLLIAVLLAAPGFAAPNAQRAPTLRVAKVLNAPVSSIDGLAAFKGKVVFLEFWATWCAPCVAGIPRTNRLIDALKGQPVVFLSVTDEPAATIEAFRQTHEIKAWIGIDESGSSLKAFHVSGRPEGYLIGKDGSLLAEIFPDDLQEKDVRDAIAGRFTPQHVDWEGVPAGHTVNVPAGKTYFEAKIAEASGAAGIRSGEDEMEGTSMSFADNVAWIWGVQPDQVQIDTDVPQSFNYSLKTPPGGFERGRELMKSAVESAFGVRIVPVDQPADAFVLTVSSAAGAARPKPAAAGDRPGLVSYGGGRLLGNATMAEAARALWASVRRPVIDETGLSGEYAFDLEWKYDDQAGLDRQLATQGLSLVPAVRTVEFLHVSTAKP